MDILRNIEKKILNIANNNTNNASEINNLKKDIKLYLDIFDKREELKREKKSIYEQLYDNKRKAYRISYENYLSDKKELMKDIVKEKTKGAIRKYLECKYEDEEAVFNIPDIYTYENIRLSNNREDFDIPYAPQDPQAKPIAPINNKKDHMIPVKPVKPIKTAKPAKPAKPTKPVVAKPDEKECPEGKEINPVTKRCVNVCKDGQVRNPETGKCVASAKKTKAEPKAEPNKEPKAEPKAEPNKEPKAEPKKEPKAEPKKEPKAEPKKGLKAAKEKECPDGKEINPVTKRCVNVCKDGQVRNQETGKCVGAKKK